jgi:hypothetical protein
MKETLSNMKFIEIHCVLGEGLPSFIYRRCSPAPPRSLMLTQAVEFGVTTLTLQKSEGNWRATN